jgi:hypothetical protein
MSDRNDFKPDSIAALATVARLLAIAKTNSTPGKDSCWIVTPAANYSSKTGCLDASSRLASILI